MYKKLSLKAKILVLALGIIVSLISIFGTIEYFKQDIMQDTSMEVHKAVSEEVEQKIKLSTIL